MDNNLNIIDQISFKYNCFTRCCTTEGRLGLIDWGLCMQPFTFCTCTCSTNVWKRSQKGTTLILMKLLPNILSLSRFIAVTSLKGVFILAPTVKGLSSVSSCTLHSISLIWYFLAARDFLLDTGPEDWLKWWCQWWADNTCKFLNILYKIYTFTILSIMIPISRFLGEGKFCMGKVMS